MEPIHHGIPTGAKKVSRLAGGRRKGFRLGEHESGTGSRKKTKDRGVEFLTGSVGQHRLSSAGAGPEAYRGREKKKKKKKKPRVKRKKKEKKKKKKNSPRPTRCA